MEILKPQLKYSLSGETENSIPVIVVAAGNSTRMGGINKQTAMLCGMPVIARTLTAFEKCSFVSKIILVTKAEDIFSMQNICREYNITKITDIAEGGKNRHESVLCGINRLNKDDKKVLIHDGARPFVTKEIIYDCMKALETEKGCLCAVKVSDTVKSADSNQKVEKTVDRSSLYLAQTPQGVSVEDYLLSSKNGADKEFTDDASVLESAGIPVKIVCGDKRNIKITTAEDLKIAECMINGGIV